MDQELAEWVCSRGDEKRELIVQANIPNRKVKLSRHGKRHSFPEQVQGCSAGTREEAIANLAKTLAEFVDEPPVILKSAGVVIVKATGRQAQSFAGHPLVKAIYPNRRLGKRAV